MIELFIFAAVVGGIHQAAKKRGSSGWGYSLAAVGGFLFFIFFGGASPEAQGTAMVLRWGWLGACYLSIYALTQGGRRLEDSWQCPECQFFNDPTTFFCPCGYAHPAATVPGAEAPDNSD